MISIHLRVNTSCFFFCFFCLFLMQIYSDMHWHELFWTSEHTHTLHHQRRYITHSDSCSIKILILNGSPFPRRPEPDISSCNQSFEITSIHHAPPKRMNKLLLVGTKTKCKALVCLMWLWLKQSRCRGCDVAFARLSLWPAVAMVATAARPDPPDRLPQHLSRLSHLLTSFARF